MGPSGLIRYEFLIKINLVWWRRRETTPASPVRIAVPAIDCVAHDGLWGEHREDPAQDDHEREEQRSRNGEIWGMYSAALPNRLTECAM